jgi:hypothetical protein
LQTPVDVLGDPVPLGPVPLLVAVERPVPAVLQHEPQPQQALLPGGQRGRRHPSEQLRLQQVLY